ncbi:hypothetical protein LCGC14_0459920 [marine sediment metagenome]|uniref:Apea-like HEPN domain-containing protein n=1 Tax=marine sediment metagenome TaxID=412755 RepID=A0A0F9SKL1_9ZZZZ|nr:hypothetical protein [bacterium]
MESRNYIEAIKNWHKKAEKGTDYFVKFILEYISFIAYLNRDQAGNKDRQLIQNLKTNEVLKNEYLNKLDKRLIKNIINKLDLDPIKNVTKHNDKWWDCNSTDPPNNVSQNDGKIRSIKDFTNIIEFIYRARNNLFHGKKGPNYERDTIIVEFGYKLLKPLMTILLGK